MELETTSFRILGTTKKKLEQARRKMSKVMNYSNVITWDTFFDTLMSMYLSKIEDSLESKFDLMRGEQCKITDLKKEIKECFKQQNNNIEELIGALVKQNNNAEVLSKLKLIESKTVNIEMQAADIITDVKIIQDFVPSIEHTMLKLHDSINKLIDNVGKTFSTFFEKVETGIRRQFGIAVPIILHNMLRELCMLSKTVSTKELTKEKEDEAKKYAKEEIQKTISNYKNLYNSSSHYSDNDIDKLIDKYSFKEQTKN